MKKCPECGNPSYDGAPVCGNCGFQFPKQKVTISKGGDIFQNNQKKQKKQTKQKTSKDESVIDILKEYGYINDEAYAAIYCEHYMQKYGVKKLEFELKNKGVSSEIIENALSGINNDDTLEEMIRKKVGTKELDYKEYSKTVRYFLSKGFEYDTIQSVLTKLRDES